MVSPDRSDYRRLQAETPLIVLFKFAEPALFEAQSFEPGFEFLLLCDQSSRLLGCFNISKVGHPV
jgi:hypothetical protein